MPNRLRSAPEEPEYRGRMQLRPIGRSCISEADDGFGPRTAYYGRELLLASQPALGRIAGRALLPEQIGHGCDIVRACGFDRHSGRRLTLVASTMNAMPE